MKRRTLLATSILAGLPLIAGTAHAVSPTPAPLSPPVKLTVGYVKVGHLAPLSLVPQELKKLGVDVDLVEFARYADARTALLAGSLDVAAIAPADLAISLAQGSDALVGIMGVGSSKKYVIGRKGVKLDSWDDLKGKKVAIGPGSAVWFQFAATVTERGLPYNSFQSVNIQGGGANFVQALQRGEVDAIVCWEPFESLAVLDGAGYFAKNLEYSESKSVGAELGMIGANRKALETKKDAIQRFVWAYIKAQEELAADAQKFAEAYAKLTGVEPRVANEASKLITLRAVVSPEQLERQAKAFNELGVIPKDVSGQIRKNWDGSFVSAAVGR